MFKTLFFITLLAFILAGCGEEPKAASENSSDIRPVEEKGNAAPKQDEELGRQIAEIAEEAKGKVGVHAVMIGSGESVSLNADERFAMQSVVKLPISMAVLKLVDEGKHQLDEKITVAKDELVPTRMHSPFRDKNPNGGEATVKELIELAVSISDGTAADVLQRVAGGAEGVQGFIDSLAIESMKVKYTHKEFSNNNERQYENWAMPRGAVDLLDALHTAANSQKANIYAPPPVISEENAKLLLNFMTETPTGPNRLKGMLPKEAVVAHKTGTSGTVNGVTFATNDVGIVKMPDGRSFLIAVFVGDSSADEKTREATIAKIAKAIWDKWSK